PRWPGSTWPLIWLTCWRPTTWRWRRTPRPLSRSTRAIGCTTAAR
ncbi:LOW QUALITY PROTEIN: hypothetical protein TMLG_00548, partial [Mycobacterium tuberculosis SUMu012]